MLALVLALSISAPAEIEIHYMPVGAPLKLELGGKKTEVRYFTFPEYKLLLKMDLDLWDANQSLKIYKDIDLKYAGVIKQKDEIIQTLRDDIVTKDGRITRVEGLWHDAEQKAIDNAGGPIWPYILAGTGAIIGIVGATLYLSTLAQ